MPTKTGQAGSLTESTNLESTNLAKPTGMKTLDSSRPNQKKVAVRPLRSFEKENTVSSDASPEGRLAIYSQSERKLPSVNSLGRSHKPNSSTEATDTMSSSKPSRSNFLARLTTPTQASRNRMRETLKNTSQRTVSSPISSTSSNFPKFSSERKSPPRGSRSSPTVQSISSNHTRASQCLLRAQEVLQSRQSLRRRLIRLNHPGHFFLVPAERSQRHRRRMKFIFPAHSRLETRVICLLKAMFIM